MTNPLSGAPSHPDTSPKAVARQLREASDVASYLAEKEVHEPAKLRAQGQAVRFRDLADALAPLPATPWRERVQKAVRAHDAIVMIGDAEAGSINALEAAFRALAPEYAPADTLTETTHD